MPCADILHRQPIGLIDSLKSWLKVCESKSYIDWTGEKLNLPRSLEHHMSSLCIVDCCARKSNQCSQDVLTTSIEIRQNCEISWNTSRIWRPGGSTEKFHLACVWKLIFKIHQKRFQKSSQELQYLIARSSRKTYSFLEKQDCLVWNFSCASSVRQSLGNSIDNLREPMFIGPSNLCLSSSVSVIYDSQECKHLLAAFFCKFQLAFASVCLKMAVEATKNNTDCECACSCCCRIFARIHRVRCLSSKNLGPIAWSDPWVWALQKLNMNTPISHFSIPASVFVFCILNGINYAR